MVVAHGNLQFLRLALEALAPPLGFLDPGVGVGQIVILERNLQREAHIRAQHRADLRIRPAQVQVHRRFVFGERKAALRREGRHLERHVRSACRGILKEVVDSQLPSARNALQFLFVVPLMMRKRVKEARQFRLCRRAQGIVAESLQCRVDGASGFCRPTQQVLEAREETRHVGSADQGANVVHLP